jgi:hypothetical protein
VESSRRAARVASCAYIALTASLGCSLTHDFDSLDSGRGGGGGASIASSDASVAASTDAGTGGVGGAPCIPLTCADVSPGCGSFDDGCGGPLDCGCKAPSTCDPTGTCVCPPMPIVTPVIVAGAADATHGNGPAWSGAASIIAQDGVNAHADLNAGQTSMYLEASNFGFDQLIPADAAIQSVSVIVCRWKSPSSSADEVYDYSVRLLYAGQKFSSQNAASPTKWINNGGACQQRKYDWIPAGQNPPLSTENVRTPEFGAMMRAKAPSTNPAKATANVDWIGISVAYTQMCTPTSEPLP